MGLGMDISQVIKFEGNVDDLVWKSPIEDFNTSSILICDETHEALVLVNGQQYGVYAAGRHVLETPNVPFGKVFTNMATNGQTSFPCKVFYVNKLHQMSMDWGIGDMEIEDPVYEFMVNVGAHGGANFYVKHTAKFLEKLVGFRDVFSPRELTDPDTGMFRSLINKHAKYCLSRVMISGKVSFLTINENLKDISAKIKEELEKEFDEYGVGLKDFVIEGIITDKNSNEAYAKIRAAKANRKAREIEGYSWQDEKNADILKTFAGNQGVAGAVGGAMGGFMVGGAMGGAMSGMAREFLQNNNASGYAGQNPPTTVGGSGLNVNEFLSNSTVAPEPLQQQQPMQPQMSQPQMNPQGPVDPFGATGAPMSVNPVPVQPAQPMQPSPDMAAQAPACVCGVCGATYNKVMKFCTKCGNPIGAPKPKKYCPECGNELEPDDIFCGECGHRFE